MSLDEKSFGTDAAGDTSTTAYLTVGAQNAYGTISVGGSDRDWYHVHVNLGATYIVTLLDSSFEGVGSPGVHFDIRDNSGNIKQFSTANGAHAQQFQGTAVNGQDFYVEVLSPSAGGYTLRLDNVDNIGPQPIPITPGDSIFGVISQNSQDNSYTMHLNAGTTYFEELTSATLADPFLQLLDPNRKDVAFGEATVGQITTYTPTVSGLYTLSVSSNDLSEIGDYTVTVGVKSVPVPAPTAPPIPTPPDIVDDSHQVDFTDTSTDQSSSTAMTAYSGPVAGLNDQYIYAGSDGVNLSTTREGVFLHSGSGDDALRVFSGDNVLDGSTGSNFLTGGTGNDTFFVDDRGPSSDIWSSLVGFHSGDNATVWGVTPSDFQLNWLDNQGAVGFQGLTGGFTAIGRPNASITLAGFSTADIGTRLTITYGHTADTSGVAGSAFMNIHGT